MLVRILVVISMVMVFDGGDGDGGCDGELTQRATRASQIFQPLGYPRCLSARFSLWLDRHSHGERLDVRYPGR